MPSSNHKHSRQIIGVTANYRKDHCQDSSLKVVEELLKSINENTTNVRNLYITYVLLALYILLIVGGTNDEQLLKDSSIAVPFLSNVNLPVSRFYLWTPWIFLFVHIDLLLLFKLLASKLHVFTDQLDRLSYTQSIDVRRRVYGSPFTYWLAGEHSDRFSLLITGIVVWSSLFALPLVTFSALQVGFLPYHSSFITTTQQIVFSVDTLALIWFWPRLAGLTGQNTLTWWLFNRETPSLLRRLITLTNAHSYQANPHKTKVRSSCGGLCPTISFLVILLMQGFVWVVATLPG